MRLNGDMTASMNGAGEYRSVNTERVPWRGPGLQSPGPAGPAGAGRTAVSPPPGQPAGRPGPASRRAAG